MGIASRRFAVVWYVFLMIHNIDIIQACRRAFSWKQISTILILAVGLILTTAMFAAGYGYSAFSIPFKDAGQLVKVGYSTVSPTGQARLDGFGAPMLTGMPASLFFELKERTDVFVDLAAHRTRRHETPSGGWTTFWPIMTPGQNVPLQGFDVTDNYFDVLGISFRGLHEWKLSSETAYPVPLIVSYGAGTKDFGYEAIGREFDSGSGKITLMGILPERFLPLLYSFEKDIGFAPWILNKAADDRIEVIARLAPGITPQLAEQMIFNISDELAPASKNQAVPRLAVKSILEDRLAPTRRIVLGAWLIGGLILILCIANAAGIYLMRCNYQLGEFALKSALGANFFNLIRPLFLELLLLSGIAAVIAGIMIPGIFAFIESMIPADNMAFGKPASGWIVYVFLLVCMIFVVVVSLMPAMMVLLKNYRQEFSRSHLTVFSSHKATRMVLIISQTAIAMLLLIISYMAVRSYLELFNKDVGVDSSVWVTTASYSYNIPAAKRVEIVNETLEALRGGDPDARVAACSGRLFEDLSSMSPYFFKNTSSAKGMIISPGFVRTVKGKLLAGREFNEKDRRGEVVLLNETLAKIEGWSPQEAVGQIVHSRVSGKSATVIGVFGDFLNHSWEDDTVEPILFEPITIDGPVGYDIHYIAHPNALRRVGSIEQNIYKLAPETVITRHAKWDNLLNSSASGKIIASFIVFIFTVAAIVIVATGIVNTILFTITRRTREIAIYLALGATYGRVLLIVVSDVVKAGVAGLLLGALASWWIGKITVHFFYNGAKYHGLPELVFMTTLMLLIIMSASIIPALRILRIEISRALASEW